jgi:hypothetical protein
MMSYKVKVHIMGNQTITNYYSKIVEMSPEEFEKYSAGPDCDIQDDLLDDNDIDVDEDYYETTDFYIMKE